MARILIAGCGDVGIETGLRLLADGHQVWGLRRNPSRLPEPISPIAADLGNPNSLVELPPDVDVVYYTAAAVESSESGYRRAYIEGPKNLLTALANQGLSPHRIFFTSSTGVYGQNQGEWVDETSETRPKGFRGETVLAGEELFLDEGARFRGRTSKTGRRDVIIVRLAGIYGPGREWLLDRIRNGEGTFDETPPHFTNRIHRDDAAALLVHLLKIDRPHPIYLGVDEEPAPRTEVHRWLAHRLGITPPPTNAKTDPEVFQDPDAGSTPPPRSARGSNKRCRSVRIRESGFRWTYPTYRDGYDAILAPRDS